MKNNTWEKNINAIEKKLPGWRAYIEEKKYELFKEDGKNPYLEGVEVDTEKPITEKISAVYIIMVSHIIYLENTSPLVMPGI